MVQLKYHEIREKHLIFASFDTPFTRCGIRSKSSFSRSKRYHKVQLTKRKIKEAAGRNHLTTFFRYQIHFIFQL